MNGWSLYWLIWFIVTFVVGFLPAEIYALCTNSKNTLSWQVWNLEQFIPGQTPPIAWTATHVLVGGALLVGTLWLGAHLALGLFR